MRKKYNIYLDNFVSIVKQYSLKIEAEGEEFENKVDYIKKMAFYGVKTVVTDSINGNKTKESLERDFQIISSIKDIIGYLTPGEFESLFPITKKYDGHKYHMKDYFYTKEYINTLDPKKTILENGDPLNFLMEYQNKDIETFNIKSMICMSDLRRVEGYPSLFEEWSDQEGIVKSPLIHRNKKDERFIVRNGKVEMLDNQKRKPSYLKVIKLKIGGLNYDI